MRASARPSFPHNLAYAGAPLVAIFALASGPSAAAELSGGAIELSVEYTTDAVFRLDEADGEGAILDNLAIGAAFDFERLSGVRGTRAFVSILNNSGDMPNDAVGTLQGVDNIEVTRHRLRLYEAWVETQFAGASWRTGLYDLNSEFYVNDSAGLLIAPAFGVGSELAATGPNGPSIFPSTALALRMAVPVSENNTLRFAILNAAAGVLGDPGGVDTSFEEGALLIGEWEARAPIGRFTAGAWGYTRGQDDLHETDSGGAPLKRRAQGAYLTFERPLSRDEDAVRAVTAFMRLGVSDGHTSPYAGGWQAGILVNQMFDARPDSAASVGVYQGVLGRDFRRAQQDDGIDSTRYESALEITYSDRIGWLTVQPDIQFIFHPGADAARADAVVGGFRFFVSL